MRLFSTRLVLSLALALVTACGGGDDGNDPGVPDAGPDRLDAGPQVPPDGGAEVPADAAPEVPPDAAPEVPTLVLEPGTLLLPEGGSASFSVRLSARPGADVHVSAFSQPPLSMLNSAVTFTPESYAEPQTMTVEVDPDLNVADETWLVPLRATGLADVDLTVIVEDDDTPAILFPDSLFVSEGRTSTFLVALSHEPLGPVQVTVASSDTSSVAVSPEILVFEPGTYNVPQEVTLTGVDDNNTRNELVAVTLSSPGLASVGTTLFVEDDDLQTLVLSATALTVAEAGSATFTASLALDPIEPLEVEVITSDSSFLSSSPTTLVFDSSNYTVPQTVTVSGVDDVNAVDDTTLVSLLGLGVTGGVTVTVEDDDTQTIVASASAVAVGEGGSATFTVRLSHRPSNFQDVAVASSDAGIASVSPAILNFNSANYTVPQTVTVTGVADADVLDESARVTLSGPGVAAVEVAVSVDDDDVQTIVTSAAAVAVDEGGSATFTVRLSHEPEGPVQVAVASGDATAVTVSPASLAFDAASFAEPQTVTITAVTDDDIDSESVTVTLTGADQTVPVTVNVTDTTQPPYPVDMFVRGSFNGFELDDALVFEGGGSYSALVSLHSAVHEFKIADAAFSVERTFSINQERREGITPDVPTPLLRASGGFNNTVFAPTDPGIYRFALEASDLAAPVLTVSLEEPATYLRDMYVRGSFAAFAPVDRMTYEGNGRHTALVSLSQGVHEFKISDQFFNSDVTFSVSADGLTPIALGTPTPLEPAVGDFNNTSLTIAQPGLYLFDLDASDPAAPVLTITLAEAAPFAGNMFLRGGFNGFGLASELPYQGGGRYSGLVTLTQNTHAFKIADADFSAGATFSADAATPVLIGLDQPLALQPVRAQDSDTLLTIDGVGIYRFDLDASDPAAPVLTVTLVEAAPLPMDLYVRGSFNEFSLIDPLIFDGSTRYEARIELAAGTHAFKIADGAFSPTLTFSAGITEPVAIDLGVPAGFSVAPGEHNNTLVTIAQPGTYLFEVLVISPTFLGVTVALAEPVAPGAAPAPDAPDAAGASWLAAWLAALPVASPLR